MIKSMYYCDVCGRECHSLIKIDITIGEVYLDDTWGCEECRMKVFNLFDPNRWYRNSNSINKE